jgi:hypothetical protein
MASGRDIDDEAVTKVLHSKLKLKGARAQQLRRNDEELAIKRFLYTYICL